MNFNFKIYRSMINHQTINTKKKNAYPKLKYNLILTKCLKFPKIVDTKKKLKMI